ncbi:MAG: SOS response-associated peptidase family protein [Lachnospiraceae bacterium]|nr:SOS response-associated peptidase family protein [Lachnospiraceae bacterium]
MCCRYCLDKTSDELEDIIATALSSKTADKFTRICQPMVTNGEIKPTNVAPVIAPAPSGRPAVFAMKWGYNMPGKANPILNARVETAKIRPTFKEDWEKHRCIIPASYYYEWEHLTDPAGRTKTGSKFLIQPKGASVTWLCGLYRIEDGLPYFVVLTREPSDSVSQIHNRMPMILPKEKIAEWTNPEGMPDRLIDYALTEMVVEKA